jgi:hypothetical protein
LPQRESGGACNAQRWREGSSLAAYVSTVQWIMRASLPGGVCPGAGRTVNKPTMPAYAWGGGKAGKTQRGRRGVSHSISAEFPQTCRRVGAYSSYRHAEGSSSPGTHRGSAGAAATRCHAGGWAGGRRDRDRQQDASRGLTPGPAGLKEGRYHERFHSLATVSCSTGPWGMRAAGMVVGALVLSLIALGAPQAARWWC